MKQFIITQYRLYLANAKSIGIEKINQLANVFMTEDEKDELFNGGESNG